MRILYGSNAPGTVALKYVEYGVQETLLCIRRVVHDRISRASDELKVLLPALFTRRRRRVPLLRSERVGSPVRASGARPHPR